MTNHLATTKIGFLGAGMMSEAIIRGLLKNKVCPPESILAFDVNKSRRDLMSSLNLSVCEKQEQLSSASVIIIAVKPDVVPMVMKPLNGPFKEKLLISIAAGIKLPNLQSYVNPSQRLVRVMPNTPCLVGASASCYAMGEYATEKDAEIVEEIFGSVGSVHCVPESKLDGVTAVSGSGPAYAYMFIEAMADAGVYQGLPRDLALHLAAQTVYGSAKMVLETGDHPAVLRNRVESPGGTTISATAALEHAGLRAAVLSAVTAAAEKSKKLGEPKPTI